MEDNKFTAGHHQLKFYLTDINCWRKRKWIDESREDDFFSTVEELRNIFGWLEFAFVSKNPSALFKGFSTTWCPKTWYVSITAEADLGIFNTTPG